MDILIFKVPEPHVSQRIITLYLFLILLKYFLRYSLCKKSIEFEALFLNTIFPRQQGHKDTLMTAMMKTGTIHNLIPTEKKKLNVTGTKMAIVLRLCIFRLLPTASLHKDVTSYTHTYKYTHMHAHRHHHSHII